MSINTNGTNILTTYFNPNTNPYSQTIVNAPTGFQINGTDVASSYLGLGASSDIPVSDILSSSGYKKSGTDIVTLYELNLVSYNLGTNGTDYIIWNPANHDGFLIQILTFRARITFNYKVSLDFVIVGGGGAGGDHANSNAGGGGGAGELITGKMTNIPAGQQLSFDIAPASSVSGYGTTMTCNGVSITANGGSAGGDGKGSSDTVTGSSSGGSGSYSRGVPSAGAANDRTIADTGYFNSMISYNNAGGRGQDQNNDTGAGGGGGGAGAAGGANTSSNNGGDGRTITFGSTSFQLAGGGGGGGRPTGYPGSSGSSGGLGGGGRGGASSQGGDAGTANTGGGGGGGNNNSGRGGRGGSGTVILYVVASGVSL
jgi:hypothetical protein